MERERYTNIEGGCYANASTCRSAEPQIYNAIRFGSVLSVIIEKNWERTRRLMKYRAAYPLQAIDNIIEPSIAGHPNTIVFDSGCIWGSSSHYN